MSYDFRFCLPQEGRDPLEIAMADVEEQDDTVFPPEARERNRRIACSLMERVPSLALAGDGTEEEILGKSFVELICPDSGDGTQVSLFRDGAGISIPYWHEGENARRVFEQVWTCLEVMQREGGFFIYDHQTGGIVDCKAEFEETLACYEESFRRTRAGFARADAGSKSKILPPVLDRLGYLWRWLVSLVLAWLVSAVIFHFAAHTSLEAYVLFPFGGWMVAKMFMLDPPRLRSMGWSTRATLLSLFPPAALMLQAALFFRLGRASPAAATSDAALIFPYVVPTAYLEWQDTDADALTEPLGHGLHVVLVKDHGELIGNVRSGELAALGLGPATARKRARVNLARIFNAGKIRHQRIDGPDGKPFLLLGGHWAAATVMLWPGLRSFAAERLGTGELCVSIPHREALLVFPKGDRAYRDAMRAMIREKEGDGRKPLTFGLFQLTPEGVCELKE